MRDITSEEYIQAVIDAFAEERQAVLDAGQPVVYVDDAGMCIEERPDGRKFEVYLDPNVPRERHRVVVQELGPEER